MATSDIECLSKELAVLNCNLTKKASEFMAIFSDDLLLEILLRLPNSRAAIQSATVCKRWHSLISTPHFRNSFIEYHRNNEYSDFSLLFKCSYSHVVSYYKLPLKESENVAEPYDLSFIPGSGDLEISATCGDLLLVARVCGCVTETVFRYYICDSLTLQWFALPEIPRVSDFKNRGKFHFNGGGFGYTLVCHPNVKTRFRVGMIYSSFFHLGRYIFWTALYNSDTAEWTFDYFDLPYDMPDDAFGPTIPLEIVLTSRGTLHWLDGMDNLNSVASFDPFSSQVRLIHLPAGEFNGISPLSVKDRVRLGVVRGHLRVSRMLKINDCCVGLRIWEMESDDSWHLVYDVIMEPLSGVALNGILFFMLAFDPSDGNTIFLVRDNAIYRYKIDQDVYQMICEFPIPCLGCCTDSISMMKAEVAKHLKVFTMVSPLWPTPIPWFEHR